ncbi:N-acetylmuramoyl-L-alanine amidase [Ruminococcus sp. AF18-22]|nr:N-acetylmuramoyl-L-alanine amidase [Ruminococcus sp. AF18-22]
MEVRRKRRIRGGILCAVLCASLVLFGCHKAEETSEKEKEEEQQREAEQKAAQEEARRKAQEEEQEKAEQARKEAEEAAKKKGITIVIDPGHSSVVEEKQEPVGPGAQEYKAGDTYGTSGISTGMPEYELTLALAQQLKAELENRGYTIVMTRENNEEPRSCVERAEIMNNAGASACVRIHANGSEDTSVQGAMTICTTPDNPYVPQLYQSSRYLSDCVLNHLVNATGCISQGVWETDTMSGNNWSQIPVTIVEVGYMTNPDEDMRMSQPDYQAQIIQGIADGVEEFANTI